MFVQQSSSYLRDTGDFLNKLSTIKDTIPGEIPVTLDVSLLSTDISNLEGLLGAYEALCRYRGVDAQASNISPETLYHRDNALLYIAYLMLIWAAPIPTDRWHCSLWP